MQMTKRVSFLILAFLLAACQTLNIAPADTFNKKVVVANGLVESAAVTVTTLYDAGKISKEDGAKIIKQGQDARAAIELAREIYLNNPADANDRLTAIIAGLRVLQTTLEAKK